MYMPVLLNSFDCGLFAFKVVCSHCYCNNASCSHWGWFFGDSLCVQEKFCPLHPGIMLRCNFHCVDLDFSWIAFWWVYWCRIVFRLSMLIGGRLLVCFGSKVTTWWSLNLCGCSWGCSVLSWILLFDWLDGLILILVYCCPIEVWYVASWNTLLAESPFFA